MIQEGSRDRLVGWLMKPLSKRDSDLVTEGLRYRAAVSLAQDLDAPGEWDLLKQMSATLPDESRDARVLTFLLFSGPGGDAYRFTDWGRYFLPPETGGHNLSAEDVLTRLRDRPLHHVRSAELMESVRVLVEESRRATDIPTNVNRSLCAFVVELQAPLAHQRTYVTWKLWSEVFQCLLGRPGMGPTLAWTSYLLLYALFQRKELAGVRMTPA